MLGAQTRLQARVANRIVKVKGRHGGLLSTCLSLATGRGVDTAGQVAITVWTTQRESILVLLSDDDVTLHKWQCW